MLVSVQRVSSSSSSARHALARSGSGASGAVHAGFRAAQVCFHSCICAHRVLARRSVSCGTLTACARIHVLTVMLCACTGHTAEPWRWERLRRRRLESAFNQTFTRRAAGTRLWCRECVSHAVAARAICECLSHVAGQCARLLFARTAPPWTALRRITLHPTAPWTA